MACLQKSEMQILSHLAYLRSNPPSLLSEFLIFKINSQINPFFLNASIINMGLSQFIEQIKKFFFDILYLPVSPSHLDSMINLSIQFSPIHLVIINRLNKVYLFFNLLGLNLLIQQIMSAQKKHGRSMISTSHMSRRKTCRDQEAESILAYAHIPMKKETPKWYQSASTWRHSSPRHTFSHSKRFPDDKASYLDIIELENPSTLSNKTCTFGKGTKKPISIIILRNAKEKPAPDRYNFSTFDQNTRKKSKGKTIAHHWSCYQKLYIPHRKDNYSEHFTIEYPGAEYQVRKKPGKQAKKISLHQRLRMYTQRMAAQKRDIPGPVHEIKQKHQTLMIGLNQRNFGFGQKMDLSKPANDYPGPKYNINRFYIEQKK